MTRVLRLPCCRRPEARVVGVSGEAYHYFPCFDKLSTGQVMGCVFSTTLFSARHIRDWQQMATLSEDA